MLRNFNVGERVRCRGSRRSFAFGVSPSPRLANAALSVVATGVTPATIQDALAYGITHRTANL
ncbi:MAG: hypothetical protein V7K62_26660 [Nostoc sp.]